MGVCVVELKAEDRPLKKKKGQRERNGGTSAGTWIFCPLKRLPWSSSGVFQAQEWEVS